MIELSVALPLFNAKEIAWLALHSLARQEGLDFNWELVVAEEQNGNEYGKDKVESYYSLLEFAGCRDIKYIPLKDWIPLSQKWKLLADNCADTSKVYFIQAADAYSHPFKLKENFYKVAQEGYDYVFEPGTLFYSIPTNEVCRYGTLDEYTRDEPWKGVHYSFPTKYAKKLPFSTKRRVIDKWIFENVKSQCSKSYKWYALLSKHWDEGFYTHGFHTLSIHRYGKYFLEDRKYDVEKFFSKIPDVIRYRLENLKEKAKV
jgi:glycosyltransferase involved in cell wall biosynthesis